MKYNFTFLEVKLKKNKENFPGALLRLQILENKDLTVSKAAGLLGVTREQLSNVINGKCDISPNMCQRLAIVFNEDPEKWAMLQLQHDLSEAKQKIEKLNLVPFTP